MIPSEPGRCGKCGRTLEVDIEAFGANVSPTPGDLSVCFQCGALLRFDDRLERVLLTDNELRLLPATDKIALLRVQEAVLASVPPGGEVKK